MNAFGKWLNILSVANIIKVLKKFVLNKYFKRYRLNQCAISTTFFKFLNLIYYEFLRNQKTCLYHRISWCLLSKTMKMLISFKFDFCLNCYQLLINVFHNERHSKKPMKLSNLNNIIHDFEVNKLAVNKKKFVNEKVEWMKNIYKKMNKWIFLFY